MNKYRKTLITEFILNEISLEQISNVFDYMENPLLYDDKYNKVYEDICTVFAENSLNLVDKQTIKVLDYVWISDAFIKILNKKQNYDFTQIIQNSSSVIFSYMLLHKCYRKINNTYIDKILFENKSKIKKDIETFFRSLFVQQNINLFNLCFQAWLFEKEHFDVQFGIKQHLDIKNLKEDEFKELKSKVSLAIKCLLNNIDWLKFFVLDILLHNITSHLELESNNFKNPSIKGTIIFLVSIWGLNNLELGIKKTNDIKNIELFSDLLESKFFIEELVIEFKLKEKDYIEDFGKYEFVKSESGFQEPYGQEAEPRIINIKGNNIKLLRAQYIKSSDIEEFVNRDFSYQQECLHKILYNRDKYHRLDALDKKQCNEFVIFLICEEQDKQKLENNKKNLEERLNNNEDIKNKNFRFKIEIETREKILSLYRN